MFHTNMIASQYAHYKTSPHFLHFTIYFYFFCVAICNISIYLSLRVCTGKENETTPTVDSFPHAPDIHFLCENLSRNVKRWRNSRQFPCSVCHSNLFGKSYDHHNMFTRMQIADIQLHTHTHTPSLHIVIHLIFTFFFAFYSFDISIHSTVSFHCFRAEDDLKFVSFWFF